MHSGTQFCVLGKGPVLTAGQQDALVLRDTRVCAHVYTMCIHTRVRTQTHTHTPLTCVSSGRTSSFGCLITPLPSVIFLGLKQQFLTGDSWALQGHLMMSQTFFSQDPGWGGVTNLWWVEARQAAKYPTEPGRAPQRNCAVHTSGVLMLRRPEGRW